MKLRSRLINMGVKEEFAFPKKRKIILLNYLCIISSFILLAYLPVNALLELPPFFYLINFIGQFIVWFCVWLNYKGQYGAARVFANTFLLLFINTFCLLTGEGTGAEYINIVLFILPLVIFDSKKHIALFSSLAFLSFIICKLVFYEYPARYHHHNSDWLFYWIGISVVFFAIFYLLIRFKREIVSYSTIIEEQHKEITEKNKEITDSIRYAQNIQKTIIGDKNIATKFFQDGFVYYQPKDIVSGDFFFFAEQKNVKIAIAADCTGHGVPGALMTIMGKNFLEEIINAKQITSPEQIVSALDKKIETALTQTVKDVKVNDGMDISVLAFDEQNRKVYYSAAHHTMYYIRNNELIEVDGSDFPVGSYDLYSQKKFNLTTIDYQQGDCFYIGTDGFADQFGGEKNKKFSKKQLKKLLIDIHGLSMQQQESKLRNQHVSWRGNIEQTDDLLIIGVRV